MKLLTVTDVAKKLGVSRACVHQWIGEHRMRIYQTLPSGQKLIANADAKKPRKLPRGPKAAGRL